MSSQKQSNTKAQLPDNVKESTWSMYWILGGFCFVWGFFGAGFFSMGARA